MLDVFIVNQSPFEAPAQATSASAGYDLRAHIPATLHIAPMERLLIPTGISIAIPEGYEAQIRPRSGLALKHGITVLNSPGTIDADYRGELKVLLINLGTAVFSLEPGERIAQMVFAAHENVQWQPVNSLDNTLRGANGYGSTGLK